MTDKKIPRIPQLPKPNNPELESLVNDINDSVIKFYRNCGKFGITEKTMEKIIQNHQMPEECRECHTLNLYKLLAPINLYECNNCGVGYAKENSKD